jgi:hypothetical protein
VSVWLMKLDLVVHAYNPRTWEAETESITSLRLG